jgi:hypothetical protein
VNQVNKQMYRELAEFNQTHRTVLQTTAQKLLARGLERVHYGVDYVNDDGSPADYAVLEYADGRIEELDAWLEELEYDTFLSSVRYCYPYTFHVRTAEVSFDASGGMMDTEENVIRMYHTETRRALLEVEADAANRLVEFSGSHHELLSDLCAVLEAHGIEDVYFGVDQTPQGHALSDWALADLGDMGSLRDLREFADLSSRFQEDMKVFPVEVGLVGAFSLNSTTLWVYLDPNGGTRLAEDGTVRAYHTPAQLEALEGS